MRRGMGIIRDEHASFNGLRGASSWHPFLCHYETLPGNVRNVYIHTNVKGAEMKVRSGVLMAVMIMGAALFILAGCASKSAWYGNESDGFVLEYRFPEDKTLRYDAVFEMGVSMERGDMQLEVASLAEGRFALTGKSLDKTTGIKTVEASIEALKGEVSSPQGSQSGSFEKILNKPFKVHMKPNGRVTGFGDVKDMRVGLDMNGPGRFNVKDFFVYYMGNFFLTLPDEAKRIGDTWTVEDKMSQTLGEISLDVTHSFKSTLTGFEIVDGIKCLKVDVKAASLLEGGDDGANMVLEGDFEGDAVCYFDFANGRLHKYVYDIFGEATAAMRDGGTVSYGVENKMTLTLGN
jgi:hypothetical protein